MTPEKFREAIRLRKDALPTPRRMAMFLAQCDHESAGFNRLEENGNYSAKRLAAVWPKRFPPEIAEEYAGKPEKILSRAYADRLGNGPEISFDGWRYRGRGLIQITGRANYKECELALREPYLENPNMTAIPEHAISIALWFWKSRGCGPLSDQGKVKEVTKLINGGYNGLKERERLYTMYLHEELLKNASRDK